VGANYCFTVCFLRLARTGGLKIRTIPIFGFCFLYRFFVFAVFFIFFFLSAVRVCHFSYILTVVYAFLPLIPFMYDTHPAKHFERILAEFVCARIAALSKQINCVKRRQKAKRLSSRA
jgi:hypothetical protein